MSDTGKLDTGKLDTGKLDTGKLDTGNDPQIDYWNGRAGETWAALQDLLDRQIRPLGDRALAALAPAPGEAVLDVGCGCGDSALALAAAVGPTGRVLGVDVSRPMLEVARRRAAEAGLAQAAFAERDAAAAWEPAFDAIYSRFGVMFFADPTTAFRHLRGALRPSGRLAFVCWRPLAENPWMEVPVAAAAPLLPPLPPMDPEAPGPFAFARRERVAHLLAEAGWRDIQLTPFDCPIGGYALAEAVRLALRVGPLGMALAQAPEAKDRVKDAVRDALAAYDTADGVRLPSATWIVTARA